MKKQRRSTAPGQHRPVLLDEVLQVLNPQPGNIAVDCTVGWAGHAVELLCRVGPEGRLIGIDFDGEHLVKARERLAAVGPNFNLHRGNFAGLPAMLAENGIAQVDLLLADLGMSSMQVDDPERGFSYSRDGALDMRMDRSRGRTAAEILATIPEIELASTLKELGDEPQADRIAAAIVAARRQTPLLRTGDLVRVIREASGAESWRLHPRPGKWNIHPAARSFQALRMLVNRELGNLASLLRVLPSCLRPGGRVAIISFHSGEDRLVKVAFRDGLRSGIFAEISGEPIRPTFQERTTNPRSRSAKMRWMRAS